MLQKPGNNIVILIADTSRENINKLGKSLKSEGFTVLAAVDLRQTLAIAEGKKPQAILIDAAMASENDYQVISTLQSQDPNQQLALIVMTDETDPAEIAAAFTAGATDCISKSSVNSEFIKRVVHAVGMWKPKDVETTITASLTVKQVLLVEDSELNRNYVTAIMEELGFSIDTTDNGSSGLEMFLDKKYDLLLTDINVPVLSGLELSRIIRDKYSKDLPIIALSGHSEKQIVDKCTATGINHFLSKPFTAKQLKQAVSRFFPETIIDLPEENKRERPTKADSKNYSFENAIEMSKGDSELFRKWVIRFKEVLKSSVLSVNEALANHEYEKKNKSFHELLNYSGYFGLNELSSYLHELNTIQQFTSDKDRIGNFYRKIKSELENIQTYYDKILE